MLLICWRGDQDLRGQSMEISELLCVIKANVLSCWGSKIVEEKVQLRVSFLSIQILSDLQWILRNKGRF